MKSSIVAKIDIEARPMSTFEVMLSLPFEVDGVPFTSVTLRPATEDDLATIRRLNSGRYLKGLKLAARLADLPPRTLEKILSDDDAAVTSISDFLNQQIDATR